MIKKLGETEMAKDAQEPETNVLAETDEYMAWTADEPDGETTYHLELNNVTLHFFKEEWDEFIQLARLLVKAAA
jgi:hypothetical protein